MNSVLETFYKRVILHVKAGTVKKKRTITIVIAIVTIMMTVIKLWSESTHLDTELLTI